MNRVTSKRVALMAAMSLVLGAASASEAGNVTFDNSTDVSGWSVDRYTPSSFTSGETGGGRTGVLKESINSAQSQANRPLSYSSTFYNTQGESTSLPANTQSMSIQLFVDSAWKSLNQNVSGAEGRLASFWGVGNNATVGPPDPHTYPIIEFNNNRDGQNDGDAGFRIWNNTTGTWTNVGGFTGYNSWYTLQIDLAGTTSYYSINGTLVGNDATPGTTSLGRVILQGYNAGNNYDIYWDNLSFADVSAVPEPSTLISGCTATLLGLSYGWRRRRKVADA
jgi:hypothetical protein